MIDGFKTSSLPLDVYQLAEILGVNIDPQTVYAKVSSLIFGFIDRVDTSTGEIRKVCTLHGSLHKYANGGVHNADSFRLSDLCRVFTELQELYGINSDITRLYSVEFGVNLKLPYDPQRILKAIRMYKGYTFTPIGKIGLIYAADSYKLKIYDKGKQCGVPGFGSILRIEISATNTYLKKKHIYTPMLGDLLSVDVWERFEALLLDTLEDIVIVEAIPLEGLSKKERDLFALFLGDDWQALDKVKRCRMKKKFIALAERIGATQIKENLKNLISIECKCLRDMDNDKCNRNGVFAKEISDDKVNESDNIQQERNVKSVTETAFLYASSNSEKCNQNGIKIKGVSVAFSSPENEPPPNANNPPLFNAKKYNTNSNTGKCRGKPPDPAELNTG
ncbi:hypothetical protein [Bacteroides sp. GM023]|uniref:hypothetical protein n=1 Tax=Bacteroides sp. GM023 TaxID=2723058 RepID=UPI00168A9B72|nr:hypothetical protein [Bacteroides sp. GM023]MBD3591585.1 hypothetical protein [Bacteroides sp. GM023]